MREFTLEQHILVWNLRSTTLKWITGKIIAKADPLSYKVEIDGIIHKRHVDQMLPSKAQVVVNDEKVEEDIVIPVPVHRLLTIIA